ncbi:MAG: 16S rRNA (guanine(527)-N(7))-methyltransferase RsmG [Jatrophihabitans sp.]|uniref:16S rRNA (guanine(527)-N(7))-methyltransferase RsmG n=1 Tax=Jatrophihabitans sp. TaxID=1932789 RepID=UPI003F80287F
MTESEDSSTLPPAPPVAVDVFADVLPAAQQFAHLLATAGVERGLIGPREVSRLWDRHQLNCAVLGELVPADARVVDVGSGAGLPGLPLALARPDLRVVLVEPLLRRATFLHEAVDALGLADRVEVVRGRAEEPAVARAVAPSHWVTARAVAPLDRLLTWCRPLLAPGATLLAMKGASVWEELEQHRAALRSGGVESWSVETIGARLPDPTWVAVLRMSTEQSVHERQQRGNQHQRRSRRRST